MRARSDRITQVEVLVFSAKIETTVIFETTNLDAFENHDASRANNKTPYRRHCYALCLHLGVLLLPR